MLVILTKPRWPRRHCKHISKISDHTSQRSTHWASLAIVSVPFSNVVKQHSLSAERLKWAFLLEAADRGLNTRPCGDLIVWDHFSGSAMQIKELGKGWICLLDVLDCSLACFVCCCYTAESLFILTVLLLFVIIIKKNNNKTSLRPFNITHTRSIFLKCWKRRWELERWEAQFPINQNYSHIYQARTHPNARRWRWSRSPVGCKQTTTLSMVDSRFLSKSNFSALSIHSLLGEVNYSQSNLVAHFLFTRRTGRAICMSRAIGIVVGLANRRESKMRGACWTGVAKPNCG